MVHVFLENSDNFRLGCTKLSADRLGPNTKLVRFFCTAKVHHMTRFQGALTCSDGDVCNL